MAQPVKVSPGREQYLALKNQHPDALLLFRMGDFYETFDEDAQVMAKVLGIALTKRDVGGGVKAPLAGIPHHALQSYLGRLIKKGLRVAVCEQIGDPSTSRGIVERAVVRIVTPGTVTEPELLDEGKNNYLAAAFACNTNAGLAYVDVTTNEFVAAELPLELLLGELRRISPVELIANANAIEAISDGKRTEWTTNKMDPAVSSHEFARDLLLRHFNSITLSPYGISDKPLATTAAAMIVNFLSTSKINTLSKLTTLTFNEQQNYMVLDRRVLDDLEVFEPATPNASTPTLVSVLDRTLTPMGRRMLRRWLSRPMLNLKKIHDRHNDVEFFFTDLALRRTTREILRLIPDLERLTYRVWSSTANPRDLAAIATGLEQIPGLKQLLDNPDMENCFKTASSLEERTEISNLIRASLSDNPPTGVGDGKVIRDGFDSELDEVRQLANNAKARITTIESEARETTGIGTLKVGYNKVFGYYIEVTRSNLDRVPADFERRQTLANAERYITPELKELESRILGARDRISELEHAVFKRVSDEVSKYGNSIKRSASEIGHIDSVASLAETASLRRYIRPEMDDSDEIEIVSGRHPLVEDALGPGKFVPNDLSLSKDKEKMAIITGPNMSGKSTFIRQVALITLMGQAGSFVPAEKARIGIADRIFTRSKLSDDISAGRSTFLIEMEETAAILHQATARSLVVLDEIGRGTSTYDGLAIASAVAEYLHSNPRLGCRTLFATHYHEMTALADSLPRAANYQVAASEENGEVVFLHRLLPGGADRSYGVHVGRLAGLPGPVITRAWEVLEDLESSGADSHKKRTATVSGQQLPLLNGGSPVLNELLELNVSDMTPLEAITRLYELQEKAMEDSADLAT